MTFVQLPLPGFGPILRHNLITASFNDQQLRAFDQGSIRFDEVPLTNVFQFIRSPE
jgi:hypothetical protein